MIGHTGAVLPDAVTSPAEIRLFIGAITDATLPSALQRKHWKWPSHTNAATARSGRSLPLR